MRALQRLPQVDPSSAHQALPFYYALVLAMLTAGVLYLLIRVEHVLVLLFLSLLIAAAIAHPAAILERRGVPRPLAAAIIYLIFFGVLGAVSAFAVPRLLTDLASVSRDLPRYTARFDALRNTVDSLREHYPTVTTLESQSRSYSGRVLGTVATHLSDIPSRLFELFFDLMSVFLISLMFVTLRDHMLALILSLVGPAHRDQTERVLRKMWFRLGFYLRARVLVMLALGILTWLSLKPIGMPYAVLLATVVGLGEVIPRYGSLLARIPVLGVAALQGVRTFALVLIASFVVEILKSHIISPVVEGRQLHVHPLLAFVSVLVGVRLLGLAGAFIALPIAAMVQVLFEDVVIPWRLAQIAPEEPPRDTRQLAQAD